MFYTFLEEVGGRAHMRARFPVLGHFFVSGNYFCFWSIFFVSGHFFLFLVNFFSVLVFGYHESWLHCNYFIVIVVLHEKLEGTQAEEG